MPPGRREKPGEGWRRLEPRRVLRARRWPPRGKCNTLTPVNFTWDVQKAATNLKKHGVPFEEATTVFGDELAIAIEGAVDPDRTLLLGMSDRQRALLVVRTEPDDSTSRIISARRATAHERRRYEEGPQAEGAVQGLPARDPGGQYPYRHGQAQSVRRSRRRRGDRPRPQGPAAEGHGNRSHGAQVDPVSGAGLEAARGAGQVEGTLAPLGAPRSGPRLGEARPLTVFHAGTPAPFWPGAASSAEWPSWAPEWPSHVLARHATCRFSKLTGVSIPWTSEPRSPTPGASGQRAGS